MSISEEEVKAAFANKDGGKTFPVKVPVWILVVVIVFGGVFYLAYSQGRESKTETLRDEYRAKIAEMDETTIKAIQTIAKNRDVEVKKENAPIARLQSRIDDLKKRKAKAGETMSARAFATEEGMGELSEDAMRLELASVSVSKQCRRIRLLHAALGKSQLLSSSIGASSKMHKEIIDAHRQVMGDMKYASEVSRQTGEVAK